jgi:hypothetical protein
MKEGRPREKMLHWPPEGTTRKLKRHYERLRCGDWGKRLLLWRLKMANLEGVRPGIGR